ncbi:TPM domain-containing protein [soil metagenome]
MSAEDHARIAAAVAAAEKGTSGEIRCVLAKGTHDGRHGILGLATGAALVLPAGALLLGLQPQALSRVFGGWSVGHLAARDADIVTALVTYILLQAGVFIAVWLLASWPLLRRALTRKDEAERRVKAAAAAQFAALGLDKTRDRTGILLYASLADRRAQVLADEGIYAKAPPEVWDEVVQLLASGLKQGKQTDAFVTAIERTGQILWSSLPPREDDTDELPDGPVEAG